MGKTTLINKFNIRDFSREYFSTAIDLAKRNLSYDDFYSKLFEKVSQNLGVDVEAIKHIHHSFHWYLFCEKDSILLNNPPKTFQEVARVSLRDGKEIDKQVLVCDFLKKYETLLEQRVRRLPQV